MIIGTEERATVAALFLPMYTRIRDPLVYVGSHSAVRVFVMLPAQCGRASDPEWAGATRSPEGQESRRFHDKSVSWSRTLFMPIKLLY